MYIAVVYGTRKLASHTFFCHSTIILFGWFRWWVELPGDHEHFHEQLLRDTVHRVGAELGGCQYWNNCSLEGKTGRLEAILAFSAHECPFCIFGSTTPTFGTSVLPGIRWFTATGKLCYAIEISHCAISIKRD